MSYNLIDLLPNEILYEILNKITNYHDIVNIIKVNKRLNSVGKNGFIRIIAESSCIGISSFGNRSCFHENLELLKTNVYKV